jgi:NAD(P)-dependent dehydrogenase (short-subunit alcohol dehydrogenase family)
MDPKRRVALVTGGGHGLGEGLCTRLAANGAAGIIVVDIDSDAAAAVAEKVDGVAVPGDVSQEQTLQRAVAVAEATYGRLGVLISNAGVGGGCGPFGSNEAWLRVWGVNVMSNIFAARYSSPSHCVLRPGSKRSAPQSVRQQSPPVAQARSPPSAARRLRWSVD